MIAHQWALYHFLLYYLIVITLAGRLPKFDKKQIMPVHDCQMYVLGAVVFSVMSFVTRSNVWNSIITTALWMVVLIIRWIFYQK
ncbi:MAG: hypothetical protein B5766_04615 [Candidatus Lumbricidophila eiseniae]|uniref:Uncharacterized protein n=1 Tax=Candidatus Lumbricidiphila eiseniae TaxID=1969409 RepID=A0A2A6FSA4_9MICO|nr:MAG: hypothetical protein B5766_04615 [Candidatus Lumbricidophila eiseniae]